MKRRIKITEQQFVSLPDYLKARVKRKVRHLEDSTDPSEVWIEYWEEETGRKIPKSGFRCPSCGETETDIVGGHVLDDDTDEVFITPVCRECNSKYKNTRAFDHYFYVRVKDLVPLPR